MVGIVGVEPNAGVVVAAGLAPKKFVAGDAAAGCAPPKVKTLDAAGLDGSVLVPKLGVADGVG